MGLIFDKNGQIIGVERVNPIQWLNLRAANLPTPTPVKLLLVKVEWVDSKKLRKQAMEKAAPSDNTRVDNTRHKVKQETIKIKRGLEQTGKEIRKAAANGKGYRSLNKYQVKELADKNKGESDIQLGAATWQADLLELEKLKAIANLTIPTISLGKTDREIEMIYGSVQKYNAILDEKRKRALKYYDLKKAYDTNSAWTTYIPFYDAVMEDELSLRAHNAGLHEEGRQHKSNVGTNLLIDGATILTGGAVGTAAKVVGRTAGKALLTAAKTVARKAPTVARVVAPVSQGIVGFTTKYPKTTAVLISGGVSGIAAALNVSQDSTATDIEDISTQVAKRATEQKLESSNLEKWFTVGLASVIGALTGYAGSSYLEKVHIKRVTDLNVPVFRRLFRSVLKGSEKYPFTFQGKKCTFDKMIESYEKLYDKLWQKYNKASKQVKRLSDEFADIDVNDEQAIKKFVKNNNISGKKDIEGKTVELIADDARNYIEKLQRTLKNILDDVTLLNSLVKSAIDDNKTLGAYMNFDMAQGSSGLDVEGLLNISADRTTSNAFDLLKLFAAGTFGAGAGKAVGGLYPEAPTQEQVQEAYKGLTQLLIDSINGKKVVDSIGATVIPVDSALYRADSARNAQDELELIETYYIPPETQSTLPETPQSTTTEQPATTSAPVEEPTSSGELPSNIATYVPDIPDED